VNVAATLVIILILSILSNFILKFTYRLWIKFIMDDDELVIVSVYLVLVLVPRNEIYQIFIIININANYKSSTLQASVEND